MVDASVQSLDLLRFAISVVVRRKSNGLYRVYFINPVGSACFSRSAATLNELGPRAEEPRLLLAVTFAIGSYIRGYSCHTSMPHLPTSPYLASFTELARQGRGTIHKEK